jgi:hypothetical protein
VLAVCVVSRARNPALKAYASLVSQLATNAPADGYHDAQQLPFLNNAQRAVILRANPDVLNDLDITAEGLADVFDGHVEAGLYLWAQLEPLIRRWLLLDVVAECEADEERVAATRYDEPELTAEGRL